MLKKKLAKVGLVIGALVLYWLLNAAGLIKSDGTPIRDADKGVDVSQTVEMPTPQAAETPAPQAVVTPAPQTGVVAQPSVKVDKPAAPAADDGIVSDGEYYDKERVAAYIRKFKGRLPKNYITKSKARSLGWTGGPLEPYAPGKAIGGDWFGNYEHKLPHGSYKECDIGTRGKPRGVKRLVYKPHGQTIYYTGDHYETFEEVVAR